ncbi:MAG TPA: helix-turn-helix transcriptional regulator [Candidatus Limnocylindrales bacterium]
MKRIQFARRRKTVGLSQEKLAELLGVDTSTVRRWEAGTTEPLAWMRPRLANVLKVSVDGLAGLLGYDDDTRRDDNDQLAVMATVLADAWGIPAPIDLTPPERLPLAAAQLHPGTCGRTLKELGIFVRYDMLSRRETLTHAVKALSGPALLAGWLDTPPDEVEARDHGTQRIGAADVEAIERSTRFFASTDAEIGGALSREAAVGQLKYAVDLARYASYNQATGNRLLAVIAELSGLVGFMCVDSAMAGPAQRYFTFGLRAARESADPRAPLLVVSILSDMAQQMRWLDKPKAALRLHDLAASQLPTDRTRFNVMRAILATKRAVDALSYLGISCLPEVRDTLIMSHDLYARANEEDHSTASHLWHRATDTSSIELSGMAATAYLVLARQDYRLAAEAEKHTLAHLAAIGPSQGRNKVFSHIRLACARFIAHEPEQASDDGDRAIEAAERTSSAMIRTRLRELLTESEPYADTPRVMELRDRLRTTIAPSD